MHNDNCHYFALPVAPARKMVAMRNSVLGSLFFVLAFCGLVPDAIALPSYARQTGLPCSGCHYTPPELNAAGRLFKLMGYIDKVKNTDIVAESGGRRSGLDMLASLPLGAWFETSFTSTRAAQTGTQDGNFEFPQDVSLFLAGAWASHVGSFLQVTYDAQDDHFSIDNTDIRYADKKQFKGKDWVYGLTLNNNPTVEDLWNSTPAYGYPFIASDSAPTPAAAALINGPLAQSVAGIGAYTMWNQHLYFDGTIYRSDHIGSPQPTNGQGTSLNIRGVAPYWRLAWEQNGRKDSLEVGVYGIHVKSTPGAVTGPEDSYTDFGPDFQYDHTLGKDVISVRGAFARENSALVASQSGGAADLIAHHLNSGNANAEYHFGNRYSAIFGGFVTSGTSDIALFAPAAITGSANGSPRNAGYIANFSFWPMQNLDLAAQYTAYTRFNGAATNYDGAGRNASDNNTVYLLARFVF
ncbi:MAG: hypothetical protein ABSA94_01800 [Acidobacteriaceae bacterium]|jgi:hypothetical protein